MPRGIAGFFHQTRNRAISSESARVIPTTLSACVTPSRLNMSDRYHRLLSVSAKGQQRKCEDRELIYPTVCVEIALETAARTKIYPTELTLRLPCARPHTGDF